MVPTMIEAINSGDSEQLSTNADASDTSFLKGADAALTARSSPASTSRSCRSTGSAWP